MELDRGAVRGSSSTIFLRADDRGLCGGLPLAARAAVHIGAGHHSGSLPLPGVGRCLKPASPAVPAAAAEQNDDKNYDEKRGGIHGASPMSALSAVPAAAIPAGTTGRGG
jgi:hypothetical protein